MAEFEDEQINDELEIALKKTLRPLPAPDGFDNRVLARTTMMPNSITLWFAHPFPRWAVAAVLLMTIGAGGFAIHERQRRIEGEHVRDQVLLALRITSIRIRAVQEGVNKDSHR